jgi:hypothetical protein
LWRSLSELERFKPYEKEVLKIKPQENRRTSKEIQRLKAGGCADVCAEWTMMRPIAFLCAAMPAILLPWFAANFTVGLAVSILSLAGISYLFTTKPR